MMTKHSREEEEAIENIQTNMSSSKSSDASSAKETVGNDTKLSSVTGNSLEPSGSAVEVGRQGDNHNPPELATVGQVFSFADTRRTKICIVVAFGFAIVSGAVLPAVAFWFSKAFGDLSGSTHDGDAYLDSITQTAYVFMILGAIMLVSLTLQSTLIEIAAGEMTRTMKKSWFEALLRQDMAYYDIKDVSGQATLISTNGNKYRKGVGRKLTNGFQFIVTALGALGYAFYASWLVSLGLLAVTPFIMLSIRFLIKMNNSQTARANETYAKAGSIASTAVSSIRTVLSLNAVEKLINLYNAATLEACQGAVSDIWLVGLANGIQLCSVILSYIVLTLLGAFLLYQNVRETGCDPSGTVEGNETCDPSGADVFGALMGLHICAGALPQVSVAIEAFTGARTACYPAIAAMSRKLEKKRDENQVDDESDNDPEKGEQTQPTVGQRLSLLPEYKIDSTSEEGLKPTKVVGDIEFCNVSFSYPSRPEIEVLRNFCLKVEAGKTVAIVGPSGCGKSTIVQLIERFYDPTAGSITLDGIDLKMLNVKWLRERIGLVQQEPKLFGMSLRENIALGTPGITQERIEEATKMANAHGYILSFPEGYDTQVGDLGSQLSGGERQRIAIARSIIKKPKILLFDEATSALDSESEAAVQQALNRLLKLSSFTTLVIAHRLSTIKQADVIAVVSDGRVVEKGTHEELISIRGRYFDFVQAQKMKSSKAEASETQSNEHKEEGYASLSVPPVVCIDSEPAVIRFRNVRFHYPARPDAEVFRRLNLTVRPQETLAIVGPSGCGKSTIVQLIERFYDPNDGTVEYDGVDMREINVRWLRDEFGLVNQDATLFANATIEENIRYGYPKATKEQIIEAAKQANCHDFITSFPDEYLTRIGENSSLVSGGEKARICLARALVKKPRVILLDEATAALDSENEKIVQVALDAIMKHSEQTCVVIAHRLSTIQSADRIAVIDNGMVQELGTHDELMAKPSGHYRRLQELQDLDSHAKREHKVPQYVKHFTESEVPDIQAEPSDGKGISPTGTSQQTTKREKSKHSHRIWRMGFEDRNYLLIGAIGALLAGLMFPAWGFVFAYMIDLLYQRVEVCPPYLGGFGSCQAYYDDTANDMRRTSFLLFYAYLGLGLSSLSGNVLLYWGFGSASERMNKRVRDIAFTSLLRQEVAWFDLRSPGTITSRLAEDASLLHAYSGEPIRTLVLNLTSVLIGVTISFVFMWPFALLALALTPFMAFAAQMKMRRYYGEDEGQIESQEERSSGGILIETLSNIRTVASLTLERQRALEYDYALQEEDPVPVRTNFARGSATSLGQFVQMWSFALMFWWGGWLLVTYPDAFTFRSFLISMFSLFLAMNGLAMAAQGTVDRDKAKEAAARIFELIDRKSEIDPLGEGGKKNV